MFKIVIMIALVVVAFLGLESLERRTLYYPDRQMDATPKAYGLNYEEANFSTTDHKRINGWVLPIRGEKTHPTLLYCHGNAGNITHRLGKALIFEKLGLNVLLFDYRGYGRSEGVPSENGTYLDADAAYAYLTQVQHIAPDQIILYGESLGCAVAVEMACRHPAAALVLESPFTSTLAMGKLIYPWLPVRWIIRYRYDNLSKMGHIHIPLLILHSPHDDVVPFAMGKELYAAAPGPKKFVELMGDHNGGFEETGVRYSNSLRDFLDSVTKLGKVRNL